MKKQQLICVIAGVLLVCSAAVKAQEMGYWRAQSSTAQSVTGDVAMSDTKLLINNFYSFPIVRARDLAPAEVSAVFDADSNSGAKGHLYKLSIPAAKKLQHKNTLCGSEDTEWMATYVDGRTLNLAFFSGQKPPTFTVDSISNSTSLCGIYSYAR